MPEPTIFGSPNPFGELSTEVLEDFEQEVGCPLPTEFRSYLTEYNGAEILSPYLPIESDDFDCAVIHHVHGLHSGPSHSRMQANWQHWRYYDLDRWHKRLRRFVVFADTSTGDLLSIDVKSGSIWLYEHDVDPRLFFRLPGRHSKIADGLYQFFERLLSESEYQRRIASEPGHAVFQEQMKEMKRQRAAEVKAHLEKLEDRSSGAEE